MSNSTPSGSDLLPGTQISEPHEDGISELEREAFYAVNGNWPPEAYQELIRKLWKACCDGSEVVSTPAASPSDEVGKAVERLERDLAEKRDCSVCDGYGKVRRYDPPYGQRDCGGCDATGERLVMSASQRAAITTLLKALSDTRAEVERYRGGLKTIAASAPKEDRGIYAPNTYKGGFDAAQSWAAGVARAALNEQERGS